MGVIGGIDLFRRGLLIFGLLACAGTGAVFARAAARARSVGSPSFEIETAMNGDEVVSGRVLIRLRKPLPRDLRLALQQNGVLYHESLDGGVEVLDVPPVAPPDYIAECFRQLDEVDFCEADTVVHADFIPNDSQYPAQWHLPKIGAPRAWNVCTGYSNIIIAIVDTGIDLDHPDLKEKIVQGYNFIAHTNDANDDHGHGTHVAGIAGAATDNGAGVAGVGYRCALMPVKVLDSTGTGSYATVASGIGFAARNGARVINLSLAGTAVSQALHAAVQSAVQSGALVVAAAGNEHTTNEMYPAAYVEAVSVAASTPTDVRAPFSNYGSWVDIAAPGTAIVSTFPINAVTLGGGANGYQTLSGTSMAAPVVSGVAGLLYSYLGAGATPAKVRGILEATADPIAKSYTTNGRVDAGLALERASSPATIRQGTVRSISIHLGRWKHGDVSSVRAADDQTFDDTAQAAGGVRTAEVDLDIDSLDGIAASFDVSILSKTSAYTSQMISLYNWARDRYEIVDKSNARPAAAARRVSIASAPGVYLKNGLLRVRVTNEARAAFVQSIDFVSADVLAN
ncbi:MAG: peptidase S8 [Planctomycetes bacterium]|nr:peptidase S8 [Planctomycetota bacterium]